MYYLGIDYSLNKTGYVLLKSNHGAVKVITYGVLDNKKHLKGPSRLVWLSIEFSKLLRRFKTSHVIVGVEGYSFGSRSGMAFSIGEGGGILKLLLELKKLKGKIKEFYYIPPTKLKKFVTGKGNCEKSLILKAVYKKWNFDTDDDNIADAYGIAIMTSYIHKLIEGYTISLTKAEQSVLKDYIKKDMDDA